MHGGVHVLCRVGKRNENDFMTTTLIDENDAFFATMDDGTLSCCLYVAARQENAGTKQEGR